MNKILSLFIILFLIGSTYSINGQDLHFTQYEFAPLTVNPALAGAYSGSYRLGGIYRDQYRSVTSNPYRTLDVYVDAPIVRGFRKQDWIGIGIGSDIIDEAGAVGFKTTFYRLNAAYHLSLDPKQMNIFTIGLQYNNASVSVNQVGPEQDRGGTIDVTNFNSSAQMGELSDGYSDYQLGLMFNARRDESDFKIGIAGARILNAEVQLDSVQNEIGTRITAFGNLTRQLNVKTSFSPGFLYQKLGPASELVVQGKFGYLLKPESKIRLHGGLGYRFGDALQILTGIDIGNLKIGVSYDMNISSLSAASSYVGGFEVGVAYIGTIFKKPSVKPIIVCPRL